MDKNKIRFRRSFNFRSPKLFSVSFSSFRRKGSKKDLIQSVNVSNSSGKPVCAKREGGTVFSYRKATRKKVGVGEKSNPLQVKR